MELKSKLYSRKLTYIVLVLLCHSLISACSKEHTFSETRFLLGTNVEIKIIAKNSTVAERSINEAFSEIERIEKIASLFNTESELNKLNHTGISSDSEIFDIIDRALYFSKLTDGAFDITVGPLIKLWGIKTDNPEIPSSEGVKNTLKLIGYDRIKLDYKNKKVYLNKQEIDLGGIAKGFVVDKAIKILQDNGIKKCLVNAGGDIRFTGDKLWHIGIQHPRLKDKFIKTIKLQNRAIVTSGDYERYFVQDDKRYHHIINPLTGYPASECISVTIIANDATTADSLATGVFVLGPDKGMRLIEKLEDVEGIIIDTKNNILVSRGIKNLGGGD